MVHWIADFLLNLTQPNLDIISHLLNQSPPTPVAKVTEVKFVFVFVTTTAIYGFQEENKNFLF